jgi:hypothetical protein
MTPDVFWFGMAEIMIDTAIRRRAFKAHPEEVDKLTTTAR